MPESYSVRISHHRNLLAALVIGLFLILITRQPMNAQASDSYEITPACDECVYKVSWNSASGADYYELFLVDPLHSDGRRRIYKGPSGSAYVTVSGTQTAEIRACNSPGSCSGASELPLIPDARSDDDWKKDLRFTDPITLLHETDDVMAKRTVGWPAQNFRAVSIDITATGQRVCHTETGESIWNIGTRMKVRVAPDIDFRVKNREIIEHEGGNWSWIGDIEGNQKGTLALTTSRCGESVFISIDSNVGQFVVQPDSVSDHLRYEIIVGERLPDCHAAPMADATPLLNVFERPSVDMPSWGRKRVLRSRSVKVDIDEFLDRFASFAYLIGDDHEYDIARFLETATTVELFAGEPVPLNLSDGVILSSGSDQWVWHGCVTGDPDSKARLIVRPLRKTVEVSIEQGRKLTSLRPDRSGQYSVYEYELKSDQP